MGFGKDYIGLISKYTSKRNLIENVYISSLFESYNRVKKISNLNLFDENVIRDKFIYDLQYRNSILKIWLDKGILSLDFEYQILLRSNNKSRTDIRFFISGLQFVIECKKLSSADYRYLNMGLSRFYELKYSETDRYAGMMGFVTGGEIRAIINGIKLKVNNFKTSSQYQYLLNKKCLGWSNSFQSKFTRKNGVPIHIFHLFCDFN